MTRKQAGELVAIMVAFWPRQGIARATVEAYTAVLLELDYGETHAAIKRLVNTSRFLPSIAEIRNEIAEAALGLPSISDAWTIACEGSLKAAPPEIQATVAAMGGRWSLLHSDNPTAVRAQFERHYLARRNAAVCAHVGGLALPPAGAFPRGNGGAPRRALPPSDRIRPRPVMLRLGRRFAARRLDPPTEEEQRDAIAVLRDGPTTDNPAEDPLYREAEAIFMEASS